MWQIVAPFFRFFTGIVVASQFTESQLGNPKLAFNFDSKFSRSRSRSISNLEKVAEKFPVSRKRFSGSVELKFLVPPRERFRESYPVRESS